MSEISFKEPETVKISELKIGDFVVEVPTQGGIRGVRFNSGLAGLESSYDPAYRGTTWTRSTGYRRPRVSIEAKRLAFLTGGKDRWSFPADFDVVVRRRVEG